MSKSAIYLANMTGAELNNGDAIPLGTIIRRYGQNVRQDGNAVAICDKPGCPGYYMVHIVANLEPSASSVTTVSLLKDGVEVLGGSTTVNTGSSMQAIAVPISVIVKNSCGGSANLSVGYSGCKSKILNMTTVVEKL